MQTGKINWAETHGNSAPRLAGCTTQSCFLTEYETRFTAAESRLLLAPDDSPLLLRDASTSDIHALDWEEP